MLQAAFPGGCAGGLNDRRGHVAFSMKTEGMHQLESEAGIPGFDAHEFDGLREALAEGGDGLVEDAGRFVRQHPWLCAALALGAGCAVAWALSREAPCEEESD